MSISGVSRRLAVTVFVALLPVWAQAAEALRVTLLLVAPGAEHVSHRNGAILGQTEGNIQGRFLGIEYVLEEVSFEAAQQAREGISAVIVAGTVEQLLQVLAVYEPRGVPVFNVALGDEALRVTCHQGLFHTLPSERMLADAVAQWQQANPGASVSALAWHPQFVKFAGRDLNKRYLEQFGVEMDSGAWAGWVATRSVAEAVVRTGSANAAGIGGYLREQLGFDGQKGIAQSFRDNGQMRQPLLIVDSSGELLGEAPVRGVAANDDLDSLGGSTCQR
jgi:ABC-type branched-subunit amino acid transport system substrate-binding protein